MEELPNRHGGAVQGQGKITDNCLGSSGRPIIVDLAHFFLERLELSMKSMSSIGHCSLKGKLLELSGMCNSRSRGDITRMATTLSMEFILSGRLSSRQRECRKRHNLSTFRSFKRLSERILNKNLQCYKGNG